MATLHEQAVALALQANDDLGALFARMGHAKAPGGRVLTAYRKARGDLRERLDDKAHVRRVARNLDDALRTSITALAASAVAEGLAYAEQALEIYGEAFEPVEIDTADAVSAWLEPWDEQLRWLTGGREMDEGNVLGVGVGLGLLTPGPVLRAGSRWLGDLFGGATARAFEKFQRRNEFVKQAIAAMDERTTQCCLRVHAQWQPIDKPFVLTAEPRYADRIDWSPFHWWCRTASALVLRSEADDDLTREMREAARAEELERDKTKTRVEINPADARSRRP